MLLACAALIGSLCVPLEYVPVSEFSAMYRPVDAQGREIPPKFDPALARRTGTEIAYWSSDSITMLVPGVMDRVCAHGWCVYYQKHCYEAFLVCTYLRTSEIVAGHGKPETRRVGLNEGFSIHAPTARALRRLTQLVRLVLHQAEGGAAVSVPLARLDHDGGEIIDHKDYRVCLTTAWAPGCSPLSSQ